MTNANQPAFPHPKQILGSGQDYHEINAADGLTKREYFAAMAMQGLLSNNYFLKEAESYLRERDSGGGNSGEYVAKKSLLYADYLLNQLENNKP